MYLTLVFCCIALNAGAAAYLIARANLERRQRALFAFAALGSVALKMVLASRWTNYDVDSYRIVASLVLNGRSVYANTERYNYAPLWSLFLAGLKQLSTWLTPLGLRGFHLAVAGFLALVDVTLAALLAARYKCGAGIFFLCCPVTIILTGAYSQFDNFALLAGCAAWLCIRKGNSAWARAIPAAGLLGLSLAIKHICFLFPVWLIFWTDFGSLRKRFACAATAYGVFGLSFIPWVADASARAGIIQHVFQYRSKFYLSVPHLLAASRHFWLVSAQETRILTLIWICALVLGGIIAARGKSDMFGMYLLAMVAASPALNDYYLALPVLACAIFYPRWPIWSFLGAATVVLFSSPGGIFALPFSRIYYLSMLCCQLTAGALFIMQMRRPLAPDSDSIPAPGSGSKALTLALSSYTLLFVLLILKSWALGMTAQSWLLPGGN